MRGKPTINDGWNEYGRITPADAGKTERIGKIFKKS